MSHVPRVAVLLGAGASVDAGLPLTNQLAAQILDELNSSPMPVRGGPVGDVTPVINFVYGRIVAHNADVGANPRQSVNIERLISSLRFLRSRDQHEASLFVSRWNTGNDVVREVELSASGWRLADAVRKVDQGPQSEQQLLDAVVEVARAAVNRPSTYVFELAEKEVRKRVSKILSQIDDVSYLNPLFDVAKTQDRGLDIITLNYDLVVETAAQSVGVSVDRGLSSWRPGSRIEFSRERGQVNLYKVHGSIDWRGDFVGNSNFAYPPPLLYAEDGNPQGDPWIVIGDREKLGTDGPTLELFSCARQALADADHLVVIGYSYSDDHVNGMIRNWLLASDDRWLTSVDPTYSSADRLNGFLKNLARYVRPTSGNQRRSYAAPRRIVLRSRSAKEALSDDLFGPRSRLPERVVRLGCEQREGGVELTITPTGLQPSRIAYRVTVYSTPTVVDPESENAKISVETEDVIRTVQWDGQEIVWVDVPNILEKSAICVSVVGEDTLGGFAFQRLFPLNGSFAADGDLSRIVIPGSEINLVSSFGFESFRS